jgi:hypothetical protein
MPRGYYNRKKGQENKRLKEKQANCKKHLWYQKSSYQRNGIIVNIQVCVWCGLERKTEMEMVKA